jgi:uncharacterized protein YycO
MVITLRFSRGTGPAAALVRAVTWSWCAHVGIALNNGWVVDATHEHGVATRRAVDDDSTRYFTVSAPYAVLDHAYSQVTRPYDWRGALGIGLHRDWRRTNAWFCSELVAWAFEAAGFPLLRADHIDRVTPRDLLMSPLLIPLPVSAGGGRSVPTLRTTREGLV